MLLAIFLGSRVSKAEESNIAASQRDASRQGVPVSASLGGQFGEGNR